MRKKEEILDNMNNIRILFLNEKISSSDANFRMEILKAEILLDLRSNIAHLYFDSQQKTFEPDRQQENRQQENIDSIEKRAKEILNGKFSYCPKKQDE